MDKNKACSVQGQKEREVTFDEEDRGPTCRQGDVLGLGQGGPAHSEGNTS